MLERVAMPLGQAVYESGGSQGYVYFPTSSLVSLLYVLAEAPRRRSLRLPAVAGAVDEGGLLVVASTFFKRPRGHGIPCRDGATPCAGDA